ncbi:RDD family protein [Streptomyces sp. NPDC127084]|uniref:RDD family protein n=1 Tax=Streptomyces sp. NPDC127084 TaxID=3347133 RepID=UPI00364AF6FC
MSNDQPPPGPQPDDDPFRKKDQGTPPGGPPPGGTPPGGPPPPGGTPPPGGGGPYGTPPPGSPYGGAGGMPPPPPYDTGAYGGDPYGGRPDPLHGMPPLADSARRIVARLIDWLIVEIPLAFIAIPFGTYDTSRVDDFDDLLSQYNSGGSWIYRIITILAFVLYDALMVKQSGQTLGKKLMKMRVAMLNDGSTPDFGSALVRSAVLWLPALLCCPCIWLLILLIMILVDKPYKQGLHDKAAKTVVVSTTQ